jgi:hypothetical protein
MNLDEAAVEAIADKPMLDLPSTNVKVHPSDLPEMASRKRSLTEEGPLVVDERELKAVTSPAQASNTPNPALQETARPLSNLTNKPVIASEDIPAVNGNSKRKPVPREGSSKDRQPSTSTSAISSSGSRRQLGEWTLGKTLGAGSMGKVKLAVSNITGEKVSFRKQGG